MRSYFIVGAKLLGIYFFYLSLIHLFTSISALLLYLGAPDEIYSKLTFISSSISLVIVLSLSAVLLFKTERIAKILKVNSNQKETITRRSIHIGIILVGLFIFSTNIGRFLATLYIQLKEANAGIDGVGTMPNGPIFSKELIVSSITVALSIILIFGSKTVETMIHKENQKGF